jgi:hypothetical protein
MIDVLSSVQVSKTLSKQYLDDRPNVLSKHPSPLRGEGVCLDTCTPPSPLKTNLDRTLDT